MEESLALGPVGFTSGSPRGGSPPAIREVLAGRVVPAVRPTPRPVSRTTVTAAAMCQVIVDRRAINMPTPVAGSRTKAISARRRCEHERRR
jgi:hypothetical protein